MRVLCDVWGRFLDLFLVDREILLFEFEERLGLMLRTDYAYRISIRLE